VYIVIKKEKTILFTTKIPLLKIIVSGKDSHARKGEIRNTHAELKKSKTSH